MRQAWRLPDVQWTVGRDPRPPGSSFADGRRLYRINGRPVRVALTLKGMQMRMSEVAQAEVAVLAEKWEKAPAHVKGMAGAYVAPMVAALQAQSAALVGMDREMQALRSEVSSRGA